MDNSRFEIKKTIFGKTVLKKDGKVILKAHHIAEYAPSASEDVRNENPMFITLDQNGNYSVYSARGQKPIARLENVQSSRRFFREGENRLVPIIFQQNGHDIYLAPNGIPYRIPANEEICFSQDVTGQPTHDLVFKVVDGRPVALYQNPDYNLAKPMYTKEGLAQFGLIARFRHSDSVQNPYIPLMITTLDELNTFRKAIPATQKDYAALRDQYLSITLSKLATPARAHEIGSQYLYDIKASFGKIATANGTHTLASIPNAIKTNNAKIKVAKHLITSINLELAEQTGKLKSYETQQEALGHQDTDGNFISGYKNHYEEMVMLDSCISTATRNIRNGEQAIAMHDTTISDLEDANKTLTTRQICIEYVDKLDSSVEKLVTKTAVLSNPKPELSPTQQTNSAPTKTTATAQITTSQQQN